jgi:serine protease DegQ
MRRLAEDVVPRLKQIGLAGLLAVIIAGCPLSLAAELRDTTQLPTLANVLEEVVPAVVSIAVRSEAPAADNPLYGNPSYRPFFGYPDAAPRRTMSAGSGVIVDAEDGYVLTNHHVIADGQDITVLLSDGRKLPADLVGTDQATDIALLKVPSENLTAIEIRDSAELRVGDYVVAIGNPFGLGQTVTSGIVSALGRSGLIVEGYEDFIQTDASINPGNSGGALITLDGRLVGINTAILSPAGGNVGIGFAVPSNIAKAVMTQLVEHGRVERGQLGITAQDLTPDLVAALALEDSTGVLVANVTPGSPAEHAGLIPGDVVTAIDGQHIRGSTDLRNRVGLAPVGTAVTLSILRDGTALELKATIEPAAIEDAQSRLAGATIGNLPEGRQGALVLEVAPESPAAIAGLEPGDVILGVNRRRIADAKAFEQLVQILDGTLAMEVVRDGTLGLIVVR